jgi:hypothetical protein
MEFNGVTARFFRSGQAAPGNEDGRLTRSRHVSNAKPRLINSIIDRLALLISSPIREIAYAPNGKFCEQWLFDIERPVLGAVGSDLNT